MKTLPRPPKESEKPFIRNLSEVIPVFNAIFKDINPITKTNLIAYYDCGIYIRDESRRCDFRELQNTAFNLLATYFKWNGKAVCRKIDNYAVVLTLKEMQS